MPDEFPDPSIVNVLDFYSSAFRIKRLLRRRGWENVIPMNGKPYGFMPIDYYRKWSNFSQRQEMYKDKSGGIEFERYVAQIICKDFCNPATFSNRVLDLEPGGDYDILAEGPSEVLFHFETKTSSKESFRSCRIQDLWNFMVREARLGADMSVFLLDTNHNLEEMLIPTFEILFSFAKHISFAKHFQAETEIISEDKSKEVEGWIKGIKNLSEVSKLSQKVDKEIYFLYFPVLVIGGGVAIKSNIKNVISFYYRALKFASPFARLSKMETGSVFQKLPNWHDLPDYTHTRLLERKIIELTNWKE